MTSANVHSRRNEIHLRVSLSPALEEKIKKFCHDNHVGFEAALEQLVNLGLAAHADPDEWWDGDERGKTKQAKPVLVVSARDRERHVRPRPPNL